MANNITYYDTATITDVKSPIVQAHDLFESFFSSYSTQNFSYH